MKPFEVCPTSGGQFKPGAIHFAFNGSALVRDELCKVLESHDQAIIGNPVK